MARGPIKLPLSTTPGGVREDINIGAVPEGAWLTSSNILSRQGQGQPRPGYLAVPTALDGRFAGAVYGFGFSGSPLTWTNIWVGLGDTAMPGFQGVIGGYTSDDGTGYNQNVPGANGASFCTRDGPIRFATFSNSDGSIACAVAPTVPMTLFYLIPDPFSPGNNMDTAEISGGPGALDICVTNNRVVLAHTYDVDGEHPYQVRWSDFGDPRTWPTGSSNTAELADTPGEVVGCAPLGPLAVAIYKEDSVWVGQGVVAKNPFQFQQVAAISPPLSPASIIVYRGAHYWLARDGVIYRFDGVQVVPVGQGLIVTLRGDIYINYARRAHGAALAMPEPELWWWYPSIAYSTRVQRAVCLNLTTGAVTLHDFQEEITASAAWVDQSQLTIDGLDAYSATITGLDAAFPTIDSMTDGAKVTPTIILGHDAGDPDDAGNSTTTRVSQFGVASADAVNAGGQSAITDGSIAWSITHGWKQPSPGARFVLDGVHAYWRREESTRPVTITATATDSLGESDNAVTRTYDLAVDDNHFVIFGDLRGQFIKITQSGTGANPGTAVQTTLRHRGALLTAWPRPL